jgi:peroxiredoxin
VNGFFLASRLVLAAVFAVAGIAKLLDRGGSRQSLREFGIPRIAIGPLAWGLPLAELACAVLLVSAPLAWWGSLAALALLTAFTLAIVVNLAQGRTPDCHCFGKVHSEAVGWGTVVRNVVLMALAGVIGIQGIGNTGPALTTWLGGLSRTDALLLVLTGAFLVLAGVTAFTFMQLLTQNGRLMLRLEAVEAKLGGREALAATQESGLALNTKAPDFKAKSLDGRQVTLGSLTSGPKPLLLLFSEPGCSACEAMSPSVVRWQHDHADRLKIVYVTRQHPELSLETIADHGLQNVILQTNREISEAYGVRATPSAVLVSEGKIASPLAAGADAIRALVFANTLPPLVKAGDSVPLLELPDLDGNLFDITAFKGRRAVLLFWSPACGFCETMLQDVRSWERTRPRNAPALVVISSGSADTNRQQRFRSIVLLDQVFGVGRVFGSTGTPSAVAIDEDGRVASEVAVGAQAVMELVGARPARTGAGV